MTNETSEVERKRVLPSIIPEKGENNIFKFWPSREYTPREIQTSVLKWMEQLPSHIKYVLCELPVGSGKSFLGINYSGYIDNGWGDAYVLTPQRILQKQYEESFESHQLASLYGKTNYQCEPKSTNCDIGSSVKPMCPSCPHKEAFNKAIYSPNIVLNYKLALLMFKYISSEKGIRPRKLMVFDECHTLEHHLTEFNAIQVGEKRCRQFSVKFPSLKTATQALDWLGTTYTKAATDVLRRLQRQFEDIDARSTGGERLLPEDIDIINRYKDVTTHLDELQEFLSLGEDAIRERYVFVPEKAHFKFKEVYGKHVFKDFVYGMADRFLFMSATILDKKAYCEDLGIDPEQAAFISMNSEFPEENRPIIYMPRAKMTYGWNTPERKTDRVDMLKSVETILSHHSDENGIIHTGSFQIADWLVQNLSGDTPHRIMHHNPSSERSRDDVIAEFTEDGGGPKLLISPSITEGLDLKYDKGRFAIVAKVPYPYLGDAWVKRRMELSKEWYTRQAAIAIMQGAGRVVRSEDDWGNVYILDASFTNLLRAMRKKFPKWWIDSIQHI